MFVARSATRSRLRLTRMSSSDGVIVRGRVSAPQKDFVGWVYADPSGPEHNTLNCSISDLDLDVELDGRTAERLSVRGAAAYEFGTRDTDWFLANVPIEPIWLCPLRLREEHGSAEVWPLYPIAPHRTYVNVGFWSSVPVGPANWIFAFCANRAGNTENKSCTKRSFTGVVRSSVCSGSSSASTPRIAAMTTG